MPSVQWAKGGEIMCFQTDVKQSIVGVYCDVTKPEQVEHLICYYIMI